MKNPIISIFSIVLGIIFTNQSGAQTTITLTPFQDGNVGFHDNFNSANTNYGYADYFGAFSQPGAAGGENAGQSLIEFDMSAIPSGVTVISATLDLYGRGAPNNNIGTNSCYLERITTPWEQYVVTWNTKPLLTATNSVTLPQSINVIQDYTGINVTQLVMDMVADPLNSHGFSIRLITEDPTRGLFFCSTDYPDSSRFPKLTVTYSGCTIPTTSILGVLQDGNNGFHDNFNSANTNYGYADYFGAFSQPGAAGGENAGQSLIQFDLSSYAQGTAISSATLDLFGRGSMGNVGDAFSVGNVGDNECYLERVTGPWQQYVVTWNTKPSLTSTNAILLPQSQYALQDYLGIDVTQLVQDMVNDPANSFGFSIRLVTEDPTRGLFFCSTDYSDPAKFPVLHVTTCANMESTNDISQEDQIFSIYPNPVNDIAHLHFSKINTSENSLRIVVEDLSGRIVMQFYPSAITDFSFKTSNLACGMYSIFLLENTKFVGATKLVVQR